MMQHRDFLLFDYLNQCYQGITGVKSYSSEKRQAFKEDNICITYGELLYPSVNKVIKALQLTDNDTVLDLGSGLGKWALQVFMTTPAKRVIGIEAAEDLVKTSNSIKEKAQQDFPMLWDKGRELDFIAGNFLTQSWEGATAVYTCSTCFSEPLLNAIGERLNEQTQVSQVLSLRPLPTFTRLPLRQVFAVECSWDSALCFYYKAC